MSSNYKQAVAGIDLDLPEASAIKKTVSNNWPALPKQEVQKGDFRTLNAIIPTLKGNVEQVQALLAKIKPEYKNYSDQQMFLIATHSAFATLRKVLEAKVGK